MNRPGAVCRHTGVPVFRSRAAVTGQREMIETGLGHDAVVEVIEVDGLQNKFSSVYWRGLAGLRFRQVSHARRSKIVTPR